MQTARLVPLLLVLPFTAAADPIPTDSLVIDYRGTITDISEAPPGDYAVGDSIAGRLLIDRRVTIYSDVGPNRATYESPDPEFVGGFWPAFNTLDGFDEVFIAKDMARQGDPGLIDVFAIDDLLVFRNGSLDGAQTFGISARVRNFLDNVSLDQSFELTAADADEPEEFLGGFIRFSNLGPFPLVSFVLDKLTVKPGRCFAS